MGKTAGIRDITGENNRDAFVGKTKPWILSNKFWIQEYVVTRYLERD